jgi:hypothetical protein
MYFNRPNIARITKTVSTLMLVMSLGIPEVSAQSISKSPVLPDGLGLTIRFVDPQPGEMDLLAQTGSRIVLKGIEWQLTETEAGEYDFSRYDSLIRELES